MKKEKEEVNPRSVGQWMDEDTGRIPTFGDYGLWPMAYGKIECVLSTTMVTTALPH